MLSKISYKNILFQHKNKFIWAIFIIIGIFTLQIPAIFVGPDLDASGLVALSWIRVHNLQIGQDIVWQLGPLSYLLFQDYIVHSLWLQALLYNTFIHFFFISGFALLATTLRVNWKDNLLIFPIITTLSYLITITVSLDELVTFPTTIILYLTITNKINNKYIVPVLSSLSLLLAIGSLIKFDITIVSISIIIMYSLICLVKKEFKRSLIVPVSYVFCLLVLWIGSEQNLANFLSYFINGFKISSGFSYAMAIDGPVYEIYMALIAISFLIILFSYSLTKKFHNLTVFFLLNIVLLFVAFKHGYVRQDAHVLLFFFAYGSFFISTYIIYKYDVQQAVRSNKRLVLLIILLLGSILFVASIDVMRPQLTFPNITKNIPPWSEVFPLIFDKSYATHRAEENIKSLKSQLPLDEKTVQYIGNKTVDILPYDMMIAWIYDFNWSPRPMIQSFMVVSPYIDNLNGQHFSDVKKSPQVILYTYKPIDNRYPLFDEPLAFKEILENYQYTNTSNGYILLSHNSKHNNKVEEDLGTTEAEIGTPIKVPKYDKGYVFADIDLEFSPLGKILTTIYKPSQAHIIFKFSDSTYSKEFRFIPGISNDGVFVSQYVDNIHDLESIFSGKITQNIDQIIIWVDDPTHYEKNIHVKFVGMPSQISVQESKKIKIPDWSSLKLVQGGSMSIDFIGDKPYSQEGNVINVNNMRTPFVDISGWAVDGISQDGTVKTFLVLHNGTKEIVLPTHKVFRPDVSKFFGIKSYQYSGWSTAFDTEEFGHGCYSLSLRIERTNGQEYFNMNGSKSICFG